MNELETKQELQRRNPGNVATREIERLEAERDDLIEQSRIAAKMMQKVLNPQESTS